MKKSPLSFLVSVFLCALVLNAESDYHRFASTPPMGWNSWDCFGTTVTEAQAKAQADAMAEKLKPFGWQYLTVDIQWYEPNAKGHVYQEGARLQMDNYSRLIPALTKFPSAADGVGFKTLADYVHSKGLKFGIHIMRGIPKQAVAEQTAILGSNVTAADIAKTNSYCAWNPDMWGVDMSKPGAQDYYNSLFELYASWGVDLVKVDDIARPYDSVQKAEIEAIRKAIDHCGRPIVLSLSPGDTPIEQGDHVMQHANMWRISDDFWDRWPPLYGMFGRLDKWTPYRTTGAWPDADMLPFGIVEFDRETRFTEDELKLCMTLWCIARSPLILGSDMTRMDAFTTELLTNPEVLAVNQASGNNRQLCREDDLIVWTADVPGSDDKYVALFNAQSNDEPFDLDQYNYCSRVIRGNPGDEVVDIEVPISGAKSLVLVVEDGGDSNFYDQAGWLEPTLVGAKGECKLTDLEWGIAYAGWGQVIKNKGVDGCPLLLDGKTVDGIGTHSVSVIEFNIPEGYDFFRSKGVLTQGCAARGSIEFRVLVDPVKSLKPESSRVSVKLHDLGISGNVEVRDLWKRESMGMFEGEFGMELPLHSAGLFRISPR